VQEKGITLPTLLKPPDQCTLPHVVILKGHSVAQLISRLLPRRPGLDPIVGFVVDIVALKHVFLFVRLLLPLRQCLVLI